MAERAGQPRLSIVVAAWHGAALLARCLESLAADGPPGTDEVIVARNFDGAEGAAVVARHPGVVDVVLERTATVPRLRAAGLARAQGTRVAFLEDHAAVVRGWREAIVRAHAEGHDAVGGPVANDPAAAPVDWAVYFYDYGRYAPPCASGPASQLSGINCSYSRHALDSLGDALADGVREDVVQPRLLERGYQLFLESGATVVQRGHHTAVGAATQAFHLARGYATRRGAAMPGAARGVRAFGSVALPAVMLYRIARRVAGAPGLRKPLLFALPWLAMLVGSWSLGEAMGYVAGAGRSDEQWR